MAIMRLCLYIFTASTSHRDMSFVRKELIIFPSPEYVFLRAQLTVQASDEIN
jgi:hypothetical protein